MLWNLDSAVLPCATVRRWCRPTAEALKPVRALPGQYWARRSPGGNTTVVHVKVPTKEEPKNSRKTNFANCYVCESSGYALGGDRDDFMMSPVVDEISACHGALRHTGAAR